MKLITNFKFGRIYEKKGYTLFEAFDLEILGWPQIRRSAYVNQIDRYCYEPEDETNGYDPTPPQKDLRGIKKFHYKGKYPKPRNR